MIKQSSARRVQYDLRPSKQIERKMILDSLNVAMEGGFSIPKYRYVGMGGNRFYDFVLVHKVFGIRSMVSLEHDDEFYLRAQFNAPYKFIEVKNASVGDFVSGDSYDSNSIFWLDYDGNLNLDVVQDIATLGVRVHAGDFVFCTVRGSPSKFLRNFKTTRRLVELKELFGALSQSLTVDDVENSNFSIAIIKILRAAFTNAFAFRRDAKFWPFFQILYADGAEMITYGGVFALQEEWDIFRPNLESKMALIYNRGAIVYRIERLNLTEKERILFDLAATSNRSNSKEVNKILELGFLQEELHSYRELLRYHPRYVETII